MELSTKVADLERRIAALENVARKPNDARACSCHLPLYRLGSSLCLTCGKPRIA